MEYNKPMPTAARKLPALTVPVNEAASESVALARKYLPMIGDIGEMNTENEVFGHTAKEIREAIDACDEIMRFLAYDARPMMLGAQSIPELNREFQAAVKKAHETTCTVKELAEFLLRRGTLSSQRARDIVARRSERELAEMSEAEREDLRAGPVIGSDVVEGWLGATT
jgi:hypothetical protein